MSSQVIPRRYEPVGFTEPADEYPLQEILDARRHLFPISSRAKNPDTKALVVHRRTIVIDNEWFPNEEIYYVLPQRLIPGKTPVVSAAKDVQVAKRYIYWWMYEEEEEEEYFRVANRFIRQSKVPVPPPGVTPVLNSFLHAVHLRGFN